MARKPGLPFDLEALRAAGVTRWRYKTPRLEIELEMAPAPAPAPEPTVAWEPDDKAEGPEPEDEGDPRFLLERIAEANAKGGRRAAE